MLSNATPFDSSHSLVPIFLIISGDWLDQNQDCRCNFYALNEMDTLCLNFYLISQDIHLLIPLGQENLSGSLDWLLFNTLFSCLLYQSQLKSPSSRVVLSSLCLHIIKKLKAFFQQLQKLLWVLLRNHPDWRANSSFSPSLLTERWYKLKIWIRAEDKPQSPLKNCISTKKHRAHLFPAWDWPHIRYKISMLLLIS